MNGSMDFRDLRALHGEINFSYKGTGTYSDRQTYNTFYPKHFIKQIPYSEFEWSGDRPHIYVNTWNHLFGEKNNNPELSCTARKNYPLLFGTREKAESDFKLGSVSIDGLSKAIKELIEKSLNRS